MQITRNTYQRSAARQTVRPIVLADRDDAEAILYSASDRLEGIREYVAATRDWDYVRREENGDGE